ncbi:MAG: hypothetical protein SNF33_02840 [Candidatus Algichlamydia australiensis]|nr:hypothetical protein [Chlamydiales bacterium]
MITTRNLIRHLPATTVFQKRWNSGDKKIKGVMEESGFLYQSPSEKLKTLAMHSRETYQDAGINAKRLETCELLFQKRLAQSAPHMPIKPSLISENPTSEFWHRHHKVHAPFKDRTVECFHTDKEHAVQNLSNLFKEGKLCIETPNAYIITHGCDNNDAGLKVRLNLEELSVKTHGIALDISLHALSMSRGLDTLVNDVMPTFSKSDIVFHDLYSENSNIHFPSNFQKLALAFRLTAISPIQTIVSLTKKIISSSDFSIIAFLSDDALTISSIIERGYKKKRGSANLSENLVLPYYQANQGSTLGVWDAGNIYKLVDLCDGKIITMDSVRASDDHNNPINVVYVIVENINTVERKR